MKKHNMMRVASALAVVTLLSTSVISGTLAKYTSTASGTSVAATVAKWSFKVGVGGTDVTATNDITGTNTFDFDLFGSIKDAGGTADETDVTGKRVIAPGTSGQITLALKNDSQVNTKYNIEFSAVNDGNIPLKYAIAQGTNTSYSALDWKDSVQDLNEQNKALNVGESNTTSYTVYWKWDYEVDTDGSTKTRDDSDTMLGVGAQTDAATATITATVTATQVD